MKFKIKITHKVEEEIISGFDNENSITWKDLFTTYATIKPKKLDEYYNLDTKAPDDIVEFIIDYNIGTNKVTEDMRLIFDNSNFSIINIFKHHYDENNNRKILIKGRRIID